MVDRAMHRHAHSFRDVKLKKGGTLAKAAKLFQYDGKGTQSAIHAQVDYTSDRFRTQPKFLTANCPESRTRDDQVERTVTPTESDFSTYSYPCTGDQRRPTSASHHIPTENSDSDVDVVFGVEESQQDGDPDKTPNVTEVEPCLPTDPQLITGVSRGFAFGQRVRNAWRYAKNSLRYDRYATPIKIASGSIVKPLMTNQKSYEGTNMGDQESNFNQQSTRDNETDRDLHKMNKDSTVTGGAHLPTDLVIRHNADHLVQSLKEATLQLARRDMEMQRLITVNTQLGERYCRMRTQYAELAREQARLRQRFDMLLVKGMDHDQLKAANTDLETQLDELRAQLAAAEERAAQNARRLSRVEAESREVVQNASTADVQVSQLRAEIQRKDAQICSLTCRRYIDAAREVQARMIQNELMELKGNIRVLIRCHSDQEAESAFQFLTDDTMVLRRVNGSAPFLLSGPSGRLQMIRAYRIFQPGATQKAIFDEVSELVTSCVDGYSVSVAAYGQTGTGKTYTMLGVPSKPGIIPRVTRHLLAQCQQRAPLWSYRISIAVIQVYQETIIDLLAEPNSPTTTEQLGRVTLHDNGKQILLRGAKEVEVLTEEEILEEIRKARVRRQASSVVLNTSPSFLHFVVILRVRGVCRLTEIGEQLDERETVRDLQSPTCISSAPLSKEEMRLSSVSQKHVKCDSTKGHKVGDMPMVTHGLCILSDLAGFDVWSSKSTDSTAEFPNPRSGVVGPTVKTKSKNKLNSVVSDTKTASQNHRNWKTGDDTHMLEAKHLGRSLITLERVFESLAASASSGTRGHAPYRDSKLTHLLKPALMGDAKFLLIVTINPERPCLEGTLRSLKLANKASFVCCGRSHRNTAHHGGIRTGTGAL